MFDTATRAASLEATLLGSDIVRSPLTWRGQCLLHEGALVRRLPLTDHTGARLVRVAELPSGISSYRGLRRSSASPARSSKHAPAACPGDADSARSRDEGSGASASARTGKNASRLLPSR